MDELDLADWRARVASLYLSDVDLTGFRAGRDALFAEHPQSPIPAAQRPSFAGLPHYPANPAAIVDAELTPASGGLDIDTGGPDGVVHYRRFAIANTSYGPLTLFWIEAYGGGIFVPLRDATSGHGSYGGGRYLTDTVKGTHGRGLVTLSATTVRLDFNYAYNPSCAYNDAWACPLAPHENWLTTPVEAGEKTYHA